MSALPVQFYKFQSFTAKTLKWLTSGALHFSDPKHFNDPFDCSAEIKNDLSESKLRELAVAMLQVEMDRQRQPIRQGLEDNMATLQDPRVTVSQREIMAVIKANMDAYFEDFGVLCLSKTVEHPLMWAHYADSHQGIALAYRGIFFDDLDGVTELQMVDYKGDKAIQTSWLFECFVEGKENFKKVEDAHFFTKSHEWGYEEEWRAISWRSKGTFRSPKADLIGVYLGYRCPPEVCVTIARLFRGENNAPKFYRMKPCSPKGDLKAEPLAIEALMVENFECGLYQKYQSRLLDGFSAD